MAGRFGARARLGFARLGPARLGPARLGAAILVLVVAGACNPAAASPTPTDVASASPTASPAASPSATPAETPTTTTSGSPAATVSGSAPASSGHFVALGSTLYDNNRAVLLAGGRVLLAGGGSCSATGACVPVFTTQLYDPSARTFKASAPLTGLGDYVESATLLKNGRVLLLDDTVSAMSFDPATGHATAAGSWTPPGSTGGPALSQAGVALLANGRVLVAGGWTYPGATYMAELYDAAGPSFAATGNLVQARTNAQAVLLASGKVLLVGGDVGAVCCTATASTELYDPATGAFAATGPMVAPREYFSLAMLGNGRVLIAGGANQAGPGPVLKTAEVYDPATGTFTAVGSMLEARENARAIGLKDGRVLIIGGDDGTTPYRTTEIYDPATGTFSAGPTMVPGQQVLTATLLVDGTVLITRGGHKALLFVP